MERAEKRNAPANAKIIRLCPWGHGELHVHLEGEVVWRCPHCHWTERSAGSGVQNPDFDFQTVRKQIEEG